MTTRRQDAAPQLADLEHCRYEHERHRRNHPCAGVEHAIADLDREEARIYSWIAEEENADVQGS